MFDTRIERAIEQLWIHPWNGDGKKAKELLEEVAKEGNGDAYYFLGRCYLGKSFIMPKFGFEENDELGMECFNKSIELGSAIGMFATRRLAGFEPRSGKYIHPPYQSVKDVWEAVSALAEQGQTFCQYLVANAYYYGDCIELMEIPEEQVDLSVIQSFQRKAIELYDKSIEKGFTMPISNLIDILSSGDYGIEENPKRVQELIEIGAKYQHPYYEFKYATQLEDIDVQMAVMYYERSILHGETGVYYYLGNLYGEGKKLPRDLNKAMYYYKKGLEENENSAGCNNGLGEIYFKGGDGIKPDYEKAVKCFKIARSQDSTWCSSMLGQCYLKGLGTEVDYEAARNEFMQNPEEELSAVGLGEIYCYGLGVKANPSMAMTKYIMPNMNNVRAQEICEEYKSGKIGGIKAKLFTLAVEYFVCTIIAMVLCLGARLLLVDLPIIIANQKDTSVHVEEPEITEGAVGAPYVDGVEILTSYEEVLASEDVFVLSMDNIADYGIEGDEEECWCVAFFDGKYIPVKYNYNAATSEYSPIGKLIKEPSGKSEELKQYTQYDESKIEKDIYIDMDGGMKDKQAEYDEEVQEAERQAHENEISKQEPEDSNLNIVIVLAWFPLIFILHFIGAKIGLFQPVIRRKGDL